MNYKFIINPAAGNGRALKKWQQLYPKLKQTNLNFTWELSQQPGHTQQLAHKASQQSLYDAVISVGGDGTTWEIINGLAESNLALGIIPAGSGNDLANNFHLPANPTNVCNLLADPNSINLHLGQAKNKYFLNLAGIGFDAEVAAKTNNNNYFGGRLAYISSILSKALTFSGVKMKIETDTKTLVGDYLLIAVACNGTSFGVELKSHRTTTILKHNLPFV